jgi:light-regulated signal transduction histidine kinase (bacteriophytochrome)
MSISIICDGKLWGLVACHHRAPRSVPPQMRAVCEFLGQVLSLQIASCEQIEAFEARMGKRAICARLIELMAMEDDFARGLTAYTPNLLDVCGASSAIIVHGDRYTVLGDAPFAPEGEHLTSLCRFLSSSMRDGLFVTESLPMLHPPAEAYKELGAGLLCIGLPRFASGCMETRDFMLGAGLLCIGLPRVEQGAVLWFRKEVARTVHWAGDPRKRPGPDGQLTPRRSFSLWLEQVRGRALPFSDSDIEAARTLRDVIVGIVVRKAEDTLNLGAELARGVTDADALALVTSHDLLDPLRGIQRYGEFLMAGHGDRLDEEGRRKLQAMLLLVHRMGAQLDALQRYARAGGGSSA